MHGVRRIWGEEEELMGAGKKFTHACTRGCGRMTRFAHTTCAWCSAREAGAREERRRIVKAGRKYFDDKAGTTSFSLAHLMLFLDGIESGKIG
jgi:hypothetical protein